MDEIQPVETQEYPKWVEPHASHVAIGRTIVTPAWDHFHVARDQSVTVLVNDADEEARALAEAPKVDAVAVEAVEAAPEVEEPKAEDLPADLVDELRTEESHDERDHDDLETSNTLIH